MIRRVLAVAGVMACLAVGFVATANVASAQYEPGQCGFIVTPSSVVAGETVSITGQGFPSGSVVTFSLGGIVIAQATASTDGTGVVSTSATIPSNIDTGSYTITADCAGTVATQSINISAASSSSGNTNSGSTSGSLASTGLDPMPIVKIGLLLLACGGLVVLASKRREHARS